MEISEWAERLLFGENLEDKLFPLGQFTDEKPPETALNCENPGRSARLKPGNDGTAHFPKVHELEKETARARALHHFANHELLAIEIMAMTLLKFPEAPKAFRRGLVATIVDEQKHLDLYVRRMRALGLDLGDIPLNDYFWKNFADLSHPIDFTVRMSLTFEQANLDFSLFYQTLFAKIGDAETAAILKTVYDDEVVHVRHGLHWFDHWRTQTRWRDFCDRLPFPLTPQRAKGQAFFREARLDAGLDEEFIDRLETFTASKGRVPSLFLFHPDCEEEWISPHYQRPRHTQQLFEDLSFLPAYSAKTGDTVLVHRKPSIEFLKNLQMAGFEIPELLELGELTNQNARKFSSFEPWGWTPQMAKWIRKQNLDFAVPPPERPARDLFSKTWSVALLKEYLEVSDESFLCPRDVCGVVCASEEEALEAVREALRTHPRIVVKAAYGASGRHFLRADSWPLTDAQKNLLKSFFKKQPAAIVEPWLDKVFDYSLQITAHADKPAIHGQARFLTTPAGQYQGALLGGFTTALSPETKRFLNDDGRDPLRMQKHFARLAAFVSKRAGELGYTGPVGIDALVYRDSEGRLRLRPIVEANCRYNMGRIVVDMEKKLNLPGVGMWRIFHLRDVEKMGYSGIAGFENRISVIFQSLNTRKIDKNESYFIKTTDPDTGRFVSILFWAPNLNQMLVNLGKVGILPSEAFKIQSAGG